MVKINCYILNIQLLHLKWSYKSLRINHPVKVRSIGIPLSARFPEVCTCFNKNRQHTIAAVRSILLNLQFAGFTNIGLIAGDNSYPHF